MRIIRIIVVVIVTFLLGSCNWSGSDKTEELYVRVHRFDKLLCDYVTLDKFTAFQRMQTECVQETKMLVEDVLDLGSIRNEQIGDRLKDFYSDTILIQLMNDALKKYEDMTELEKQFSKAFQRLEKEIPSLKAPLVYSQISALNQSVVVGDGVLGFSIDKYMGKDYPLYKTYYYDYQIRHMTPDYIVSDCLLYYLTSEYPFPWEYRYTLLDHVIYSGKICWALVQLTGQSSIAQNLGYSKEEEKWCKENEKKLWEYLTSSGYIYSTDPLVIKGFLYEAEHTILCGDDSPAQVGVWLGGRIVESYLKHKDVSLDDFLQDYNFNRLLLESHYGE